MSHLEPWILLALLLEIHAIDIDNKERLKGSLASLGGHLGADSRFFALLGSAPQELNTARPEAKLTC
jgi:hypothetical protein